MGWLDKFRVRRDMRADRGDFYTSPIPATIEKGTVYVVTRQRDGKQHVLMNKEDYNELCDKAGMKSQTISSIDLNVKAGPISVSEDVKWPRK